MANLCECGNSDVLPGYRVCADCKEARERYPHLFEDDAPDELNKEIDVVEPETRKIAVFFANSGNSQEVGS